jgi:hypothetical protein
MGEMLLHYILLVVGIAMLKRSATILKTLKTLQALFLKYTSSDILPIPKELYKTHVKSISFCCQQKSKEVISFSEGKLRVTCNPLPYFNCNGSDTAASYCYLKCNENVTSTTKTTSYVT